MSQECLMVPISMGLENHHHHHHSDTSFPLNTTFTNQHQHPNNRENTNVKKVEKKRRTNYRRPENATKLNAAVNALVMNQNAPFGPKDIRSISKLYGIPYNTLRDNYLRTTTGKLTVGKRPLKRQKAQDNDNNDQVLTALSEGNPSQQQDVVSSPGSSSHAEEGEMTTLFLSSDGSASSSSSV
eukprot:scaffold262_cov164-Ochromonas_danica.AAC.15